jgi:cytochrome c oxidase assembly protein subunit 15
MVPLGHRIFQGLTIASVLACYVVILIGGTVMASGSGLGCPTWPSCHGTYFPALQGAAGIEWAHRLSAFLLSVLIAAMFAAALLFERARPALVRLSAASACLVLAQALLGGLVVDSSLMIAFVLLHLALATALFGLLLLIAFLSTYRTMPKRWIDWARRASEELSPSEMLARRGDASGAPGGTGDPAAGDPA